MPFVLVAHRGFSSEAPENTLAAFDLALASGFGHIELDARLTADCIPVVIHDNTVDRTTDGSGAVRDMTLADIRGLDAGSWFENAAERGYVGLRVPTLEEVLSRYEGRAHLYIELKSGQPELPRALADLLAQYGWLQSARGAPDNVPGLTLVSFHLGQLKRSLAIMPDIRHAWLVLALSPKDVRLARGLGMHGMYSYMGSLTSEGARHARSEGLVVGVWGLRSPNDLAPAVDMGAFGATVDWPGDALDFLRRKGIECGPTGPAAQSRRS